MNGERGLDTSSGGGLARAGSFGEPTGSGRSSFSGGGGVLSPEPRSRLRRGEFFAREMTRF